ncbi:MAG: NUDIX domain-containing protein [Thermodesulfobacteriota bacterium]
MRETTPGPEREMLEVVDERDQVIGSATRAEIHANRWMHRAVHIFVFNSHGQVYVQRRSAFKDRFPGVLDSSAAGHVDPGEGYEETAARELREELGINAHIEEVLRVTASEITDYEHVVLYRAVTGETPEPNPDEIQWGSHMAPEHLTLLMEQNPNDFVPAFIFLWKEYLRLKK